MSENQREELDSKAHEVFVCIRLCYSFCAWHEILEPFLSGFDVNDPSHLRLSVIRHSCFESSILNIRRYNEFLRLRDARTRIDDIRADDFHGFTPNRDLLTDDERDDFNKRLMHLTTQESEKGKWKIAVRDKLVFVAPFHKEFTTYVKDNWPDGSKRKVDARSVDVAIDECLAFIQRG